MHEEAGPPDDARGQAGWRQGAAHQRGHEPDAVERPASAVPTHASFFSGVGGLDLGLERAGWRTVSFSEIDPYASAVLAERWPDVPNLGDIVQLNRRDEEPRSGTAESAAASGEWHRATLWSGGFPCQDLSIAGKRRGMAGERSSLAYAFLGLVDRHRPRAILLENVPGLLSSHSGRDFYALLRTLAELGYGWAYRVLNARYFGVPQRRRRVFIVGLRSDPDDLDGHLAAERAASVLAVGTRCRRHPATGHEAGEDAADGVRNGVDIARAVTGTAWKRHDEDTDTLVSPATYANGVRAADGLAGRLDGGGGVGVFALRGREEGNVPEVSDDGLVPSIRQPGGGSSHAHVFVKKARPTEADGEESWGVGDVTPTLNAFDGSDIRATTLVSGGEASYHQRDRIHSDLAPSLDARAHSPSDPPMVAGNLGIGEDDPLLPLGLDSHRYRCCGNGVVSSVAEWIGLRLLAELA